MTILNPRRRSLLTDALAPPAGMTFDCGFATTYSLDPNTLLALPLHLALLASADEADPGKDPIRLLESLRRIASRLTVFHETGRLATPADSNRLYSLLESMLHPCEAPGGGAFHPKVVLLRFADPKQMQPSILRLLVMSRNLTFDRSWDLSVRLDGEVSTQADDRNRPIVDLFDAARDSTSKNLSVDRSRQYGQLMQDVAACAWELPAGFDDYGFHCIGPSGLPWQLPHSDRLAIISPFVSDTAIRQLQASTDDLALILARQEELDLLNGNPYGLASTVWVLGEAAESNDSGQDDATEPDGLHAKCYLQQRGDHTHLLTGSANATSPIHAPNASRRNIEFMIELAGPTSQVGGVSELMGSSGLGDVCKVYQPVASESDEVSLTTERRLNQARQALCNTGLELHCKPAERDWRVRLVGRTAWSESFADIGVRAWPLSIGPGQAMAMDMSVYRPECQLGLLVAADITTLVGFELTLGDQSIRFGLELSLHGGPEDRDAAILNAVIRNRDAFMRYLLILLAEFSDSLPMRGMLGAVGASVADSGKTQLTMPMFEQMAKAFAHDPASLDAVASVMEQLDAAGNNDVVPDDFRALWKVFSAAREQDCTQ